MTNAHQTAELSTFTRLTGKTAVENEVDVRSSSSSLFVYCLTWIELKYVRVLDHILKPVHTELTEKRVVESNLVKRYACFGIAVRRPYFKLFNQ